MTSKLHLSEEDVKHFWKAFCQIDTSKNNFIALDEFQNYYRIHEDRKVFFLKMAYSRTVTNKHREVNFFDYVSHTWDYLTLDLSAFVFQLYDKDGSQSLNRDEYSKIAECVYGIKFGENKILDDQLKRSDADGSGQISYSEFVELTKRNQHINREAFYVQDAMKQHIGGEKFWNKKIEDRKATMGNKTLHQILKS
eukprot:CAMPEP_0185032400 /NCGR_PEP_ID=MMETSP1103-20130426/20441_1 /TAXON_ID=36769 /ORGANISM="Paraphysomonas bandaiensis, Strain Caron Lab Isolate" /LENGTH=194 /DNA_ID=CAMNT_0027568285 /DNA_START=39 /DNA_END=623 /DNA_ORIENTATION=+